MLIAFRDYIADGSYDVTHSVTATFLTSAPFENCQDRRLSVVAISDVTGSGVFTVSVELDSPKTVGFAAILNYSVEQLGGGSVLMQVSLLDNSGNPLATVSPIYTRTPGPSQFPTNAYFIFDQNYEGVRYVVYTFQADISFVTYPSFGRLWAGPCWRPSGKTSDRNFRVQPRDDSALNRSIGAQAYADYKDRYRQLTCAIPKMTEAEAIGIEDDADATNLLDISFEVGRASPVIVIPTTSSAQAVFKFGVYGTFNDPPPVDFLAANKTGRYYTSQFDVVEER